METVRDRIIKWIDFKNLSVAAFERKCGLSTGYVANMKPNVNSKKINEISAAFPDLNVEWLKTGEGEMTNRNLSVTLTGNGNVFQDGQAGHDLNQNGTTNLEQLVHEFLDGLKDQGNLTARSMDQTDRALDEISEQRKLVDRLISIIEKK